MLKSSLSKLLYSCICISILVVLGITVARISWEGEQREAELAVNLDTLLQNPSGAAQPFDSILTKLQEMGLDSVILSPQVLDQLSTQDRDPLHKVKIIWKLDSLVPFDKLQALYVQMADFSTEGILMQNPLLSSPVNLQLIFRMFDSTRIVVAWDEFQEASSLSEFYKKGSHLMRAHILKAEERVKLSSQDTLERFMRAVRERSISLISIPAVSIDQVTTDFSSLKEELKQQGFQLGISQSEIRFSIDWLLLIPLLLGLAGLFFWAAQKHFQKNNRLISLSHLIFLILAAAGLQIFEVETRLVLAWIAVVLFPIAAYLFLKDWLAHAHGIKGSLCWVLGFTISSIIGGLFAAAILGDSLYLLDIETFRGIKLALIAPILMIGLIELSNFDLRSLRIEDWLLGAGVAALLAIALLRSGNFSILPVSSEELDLRGLLENLLYARPRFKELLIGHPALWLWGSLLLAVRQRTWALGLLLIGLMGQVSILNSFLHPYTPLLFTLLRVFNGLWIGAIIGLAAYGIFKLAHRIFDSQPVDYPGQ
ncbi:hypothetical protein HY229_00250 [Candidatus Acetothermia bacterium]|nr:hypothetical protein [Candidatus Acetothermia bacterium]MBI3642527.1 hypothetical protein [Candidatus Acetothermia bacterium]